MRFPSTLGGAVFITAAVLLVNLSFLSSNLSRRLADEEEGNSAKLEEGTEEAVTTATARKILILAYARTGSTYAAHLICGLAAKSYCWHEPLFKLRQEIGLVKPWRSDTQRKVAMLLQLRMDCRHRQPENDRIRCQKAGLRVAKTIRLHWKYLEKWIVGSDIKVE